MIITLLIITIICSIVLSFVYSFTSPRITETQRNLIIAGLKEAITAHDFIEIIPDTLWRAVDSSGNFIGIVFRVFPQGYGGPIPTTVGLNLDGEITGVRVASAAEGLKETPGLGVKITEPDFLKQFIGKCPPDVQIKKDGGQIDAITAATISSRAVCNGIAKGIEKYTKYLNPPDKKSVFPSAQGFAEIIKDTLWYAVKDTDTIGIVFIGITEGYVDCIRFIVGVDRRKKITGIEILYSNETEGVGEVIQDKEFLAKFKKGYPDTITGATVSSKALIDAVKNYIDRFKEYIR
jgi:electron transport complex protein RnfG